MPGGDHPAQLGGQAADQVGNSLEDCVLRVEYFIKGVQPEQRLAAFETVTAHVDLSSAQ
nr:hypothetical protein [Streptomyces chartreusis]